MTHSEFRRWLIQCGVQMVEGSKHTKLYYNGRYSLLPRHQGEIGTGLRRAILKQKELRFIEMKYPACITKDTTGYLIEFRDIPEAISSAATREDVLEMGSDALITAMDFYFEEGRAVPNPSKAKRAEVMVELPLSVWLKVLLLNNLIAQDVSYAELSRRLGVSPQTVTRIVDLHHVTKVDSIHDALQAIGCELRVQVV